MYAPVIGQMFLECALVLRERHMNGKEMAIVTQIVLQWRSCAQTLAPNWQLRSRHKHGSIMVAIGWG